MKVRVVVIDDMGIQHEGEVNLSAGGGSTLRPLKSPRRSGRIPTVEFALNERAFAKRYAAGRSGPQKFAILVAYLAKGDNSKDVQLRDVGKMWNRMTAILGGKFNRKYSNKAKEYGWVDTRKAGVYKLCPEWNHTLTPLTDN